MQKDQAIQVLKQIIDAAIKSGVCPNLETTNAIGTAWQTLINLLTIEKE